MFCCLVEVAPPTVRAQVQSYGNLPQRRWGSSGVQDHRFSRPTTAAFQRNNMSSNRSMTSLSTRPVSGYDNRSRLQSRPTTALSTQKSPPLFLHESKPDVSLYILYNMHGLGETRDLAIAIYIWHKLFWWPFILFYLFIYLLVIFSSILQSLKTCFGCASAFRKNFPS